MIIAIIREKEGKNVKTQREQMISFYIYRESLRESERDKEREREREREREMED